MTLRSKMITASALVTITIFMLLAFVTLNYLERKQYETVVQQQESIVAFTADEIDAAIQMLKDQLMTSVRVFPPEALATPASAASFMKSRTGLHNLFNRHLLLLSPAGDLIAESYNLPVPRRSNYANEPFFRQTLATLKPQISDPLQCCGADYDYHLLVSAPVIDDQGKVRAVIAGAFSLSSKNILTRFSRVSTGKNSVIRLISPQKNIILHPDPNLIMKGIAPGHSGIIEDAFNGFTGTARRDGYYSRPMVTSVTRLKSVNWVLAASSPEENILEPVKTIRNFFLAATAASLLALSLIVFIYMGYLTAPLRLFTRHLQNLPGKTGKERLFETSSHDEVGQMAVTFNDLITTLDSQAEELHMQNASLETEMAERQKLQDALQVEQHALAAMNETLAHLVADEVEKNREKDHQLMQQERLVIMGELLSAISHQWRQPLNNISVLIQHMQMEQAEGGLTRESMAAFSENSLGILTSLSHTLDDFRTFFQTDRQAVEFDPAERVEQLVNLSRPGFESSGIRLDYECQGESLISGHCNEFTRVIMTILANARDILVLRKVAEPQVLVRCISSDGQAIITICDNAGGISQESLDRIFDPYYTTKFMSPGTGLGLFVCKTIIERVMHGSISVHNTGTGAEFRIAL